ncbi:carboxypeptidase regulatory-like domain-containing protein [Microbacterium sp. zg.Y1090]|uniref:carboxypeptidase regulatory-like domain-containing protein n=1 Tax=Microbacterium wangruii TaxID=3049073 RepID=UPI00214D260C|nr:MULTISPECIES: carboxypeptidase regulatory-like domain-containing protein [unclassified Microbacterium]MCR2819897.1 carboxypeptidase regulatory-like domain-containing protein [Microbacterium sp. zg.Y1090]WIM27484.1 carboxypeptidase regulatory-like domain-containing protein [Microbacterium sp. zg-Y1090]
MRTKALPGDDGFTLVEVIVAMLVFGIILTGFVYTITASLTATRDTRTRIVAANLASQQIDVLRSAADAFAVTNSTRDVELNGDTFHVRVRTQWVAAGGTTASCEAGAAVASLAYKHVSIEVTWDNMREGAQPVYSDTHITPKTKINDPSLGTVLVGVLDSAGSGVAGATVSLSPSGGVAAATTDSDGCAYLLKVPAGTYTVTAEKTGFISERQVEKPQASVPVTAGGSSRVSFALERQTRFDVTYAPDAAPGVRLPTELTTTFISTYGAFAQNLTGNARTKAHSLYPVPSGYSVLAGDYAEAPDNPGASCLAPDPGQWIAEPGKVGVRPDPVAGAPGGAVAAAVPMGEIRIPALPASGNNLKAVYVGGGPGDPGCAAGMTYRFGSVAGGSATIALPYGTWQLFRGTASAQATPVTGITVLSGGTASGSTVVLDPRGPG